jgi:hypothetical protein
MLVVSTVLVEGCCYILADATKATQEGTNWAVQFSQG